MNKKIKVLYISANGFLGGAEKVLCNIVTNHSDKSIEPACLFFEPGEASELCHKSGVNVYILPFRFRFSNPIKVLKVLFYLRKLIKENGIDIIHSTMPYVHIIVSLATIFTSIKKVWFQHGPVGSIWDKVAVLFSVDLIYFNSSFLEKEHLKLIGSSRHREKHRILSLGIPFKILDEVRVKANRLSLNADEDILLLSVGRITEIKGQDNVIHAYKSLLGERPDLKNKTRLDIIGIPNTEADKSYFIKLQNIVASYKLEENILFKGFHSDLENYYSSADVLIHSTKVPESFGMVVAEAMLYSCFVIGGHLGGVTDILKNEITGLSYDAANDQQGRKLLECLKYYFSNFSSGSEREKIIHKAKSNIEEQYSINSMIEEIEFDIKSLV